MRAIQIAMAIAVLAFASGCASIVNGSNQSLSVEARDQGKMVKNATCKLTNDKGTWYVDTPGSVTVHRSYDDLAIRCEKSAYEPGLATVKSSTKAMMFGNILFGGIIGGAVDAGTGAGYDYPSLITVQMGQETVIAPPPPEAGASPSQDAPRATGAPASSPGLVQTSAPSSQQGTAPVK